MQVDSFNLARENEEVLTKQLNTGLTSGLNEAKISHSRQQKELNKSPLKPPTGLQM